MQLTDTFKKVKHASRSLATLSDDMRNDILNAVADAIIDYKERILVANEKDLAKMDPKNPLYDRPQVLYLKSEVPNHTSQVIRQINSQSANFISSASKMAR